MKDGWTIESPNNWLRKAGAHVVNSKLVLPHDFLLTPMNSASEALLEYRKSKALNDRTRHAMTIAVTVRNADTAFYNAVAGILNKQNPNKPNICHNCIRGQLFGTRMKELRKQINRNIIHKMDNDQIMLNPDDLYIVEEYYEEMFKLPLMDPITWPGTDNLKFCRSCRKKWDTYNNQST
ncbi:MAG: thioredoxin domain-containing protein [Candidatus Methanospirareceae archaeon]